MTNDVDGAMRTMWTSLIRPQPETAGKRPCRRVAPDRRRVAIECWLRLANGGPWQGPADSWGSAAENAVATRPCEFTSISLAASNEFATRRLLVASRIPRHYHPNGILTVVDNKLGLSGTTFCRILSRQIKNYRVAFIET